MCGIAGVNEPACRRGNHAPSAYMRQPSGLIPVIQEIYESKYLYPSIIIIGFNVLWAGRLREDNRFDIERRKETIQVRNGILAWYRCFSRKV